MRIGFDSQEIQQFINYLQEVYQIFMPEVVLVRRQVTITNVWDEPVNVIESVNTIFAYYRIDPPQNTLEKYGIKEAVDALLVSLDEVRIGDEVDLVASSSQKVRYEIVNVYQSGFLLNTEVRPLYVATLKRKFVND
ncbi:hypothetical protein [Hydrogenobacter thermophilus]|jgi:hypothetical protein|uniref:hypothetical protein n=1 Tax=Hydrogenobacter thermophilus TaxID=940 RepID=UPI0030FB85E5